MKLLSMIELYRTDCVYRQLSKGSIENYIKHDTYLAKYLEETFGVTELEEVTMPRIKSYVQLKQQAGRKPSYINDMIKACCWSCKSASVCTESAFAMSANTCRLNLVFAVSM